MFHWNLFKIFILIFRKSYCLCLVPQSYYCELALWLKLNTLLFIHACSLLESFCNLQQQPRRMNKNLTKLAKMFSLFLLNYLWEFLIIPRLFAIYFVTHHTLILRHTSHGRINVERIQIGICLKSFAKVFDDFNLALVASY